MNHLKVLKWLNWASALLLAMVNVFTFGSIGVAIGSMLVAGADPKALLGPALIALGPLFLLLGGMNVLAVVAALRIEHSKGRVAQTLFALLGLTSIPTGTIYGIYAIWVCWLNPPTRDTFEGSLGRDLPWLGLGLASLGLPLAPVLLFSVTALLPTDLEALDSATEPLADRSQRVAHAGCSLVEVGPPCESARPSSVKTMDIFFDTRNDALGFKQLKGTLHLPQGLDEPRPAVILVHGSGPTDRDAEAPAELVKTYAHPIPLFADLADHLAAQGLVVLRYDKRVCGRCYPRQLAAADFTDFRFELFMDDALAAADYLETLDEVDARRLVVIGHSQGGGFAPHLAARDDRFAAVVMLAGLTGTFRDALVDQVERIAAIREQQWDAFGASGARLQGGLIATCLDKLDGDYDPTDECLGGGVTLGAIAEYDALNATTLDVVADLDVPLCAIAGTVDRNIPPSELLAIREATAGDAEFHLIGGVGHGLVDLIDPSEPPAIDPDVLAALDGFLATVGAAASPEGSPP